MKSKRLSKKELIELVTDSFEAERTHRISDNKKLLHPEFAVTDMVLGPDYESIMPRLSGSKLLRLMDESFKIEGRKFSFPNITADEETQVVMLEFVESYPDPVTKKIYRTPQVAVCEIKDGKIFRTRHYMDPRLSFEYLEQSDIDKAFE